MKKTTLYLPDELKRAVEQLAAASGRAEAEVIRDAIRAAAMATRPRPHGALFSSGDAGLSESVDDALAGFGDR